MSRNRLAMPLRLAFMVAALGALGGGATAHASNKADGLLTQIEGWLPGHYDNRAQVATDRKHGGAVHPAISAVIIRVDSLTIGPKVYYLEESDTDDPQHLIAQYLVSFEVVKDRIVSAVWTLADPRRWRDGAAQPELFSSLQPPDLKLLTGCSLEWKKSPDGFTATNDRKLCHSTPPSVPAAVAAQWRVELTADQLGISELAFDSDGDVVDGAEGDFLRLRKRSNSRL